MKTNTDEILNKYIDGELSSTEVNLLKEELNNNPELLKKLKALKITDSVLRKLEVTPAPEGFTEFVMSQMKFKSKIRESISPVFVGIISFFSLLILGVIGFSIKETTTAETSTSSELMEKVSNNVTPLISKVSALLANDSILFVGGMIAFVLLLGLYFMIHTHKAFKQSLEKF